jgi:hypothetical protein
MVYQAGAPRHVAGRSRVDAKPKPRASDPAFPCRQVPDASDMRRVPRLLRPFDCFVVGLEGLKDMVRVVFNDVILYGAALWTPLRSRLDKDVRHSRLPKLLWP